MSGTRIYAAGPADGGMTASDRQMPAVTHAQAAPDADDDSLLRLTPDRTKLVRLNEDAASVIVTNPANASVMLDSPRLLIVMPRTPGTTAFTVLNAAGKVILEKNVIVSAAAQPKYVRIRKACTGADANCVPSAYYYCPDGCYEVTPVPPGEPGNIPEIPASPMSSGGGGIGPGMTNPIGVQVTPGSELAPYVAPQVDRPK